MNLKHLADALDGWKNWMLGVIASDETINVVPMLTDMEAWDDEHRNLYARLLRTDAAHVVNGRMAFTHQARVEYFSTAVSELDDARTVFVDPDNGPWTDKAKASPHRYVKGSELVTLLASVRSRLVMVYRHESRSQTIEGLQSYASQLCAGDHRVFSLGILCGVTSLLCVSRDDGRMSATREKLITALHPVGPCRVTQVLPVA